MPSDDEDEALLPLKEDDHPLTTEEKLQRDAQVIDDSVTFLLLAIFSFFFIVVAVILFVHWKEKKRKDSRRYVVLPHMTLPGYVTVVLTRTPTHRILGHYQLDEASFYSTGLVADNKKKNYGAVEKNEDENDKDDTNCLICHPFSEGNKFPQQ